MKQTSLDLNGPYLQFERQPDIASIDDRRTYSGDTISISNQSYSVGGTSYPVRGYLYIPSTENLGSSLDVIVLYHSTITATGVVPFKFENDPDSISSAAKNFLDIVVNTAQLNIRDKIIFSVAYPQDFIPAWQANSARPALEFPGIDYPNFYLGDNLVYAEAALLWVKNDLGTYFTSNNISKTISRIFTFGHSQGAALVHKLNTLHAVDGVISNAPGPIDLLARCADSEANGDNNGSCSKIKTGVGSTTASPSTYSDVSLRSYLTGTLSPTLFTQALDDTTGDNEGTPQVQNMQNIMQVGLSTCTNCAAITFNYYDKGWINAGIDSGGGHDAFARNVFMQRDIRDFFGSSGAGTTTLIGIASAYFIEQNPSNIFSSNTGIVTHRWYAAGRGPLTDGQFLGATITGSATTTLTIKNITNPTIDSTQFYIGADYIPSAYQTTSPVTAGTGRSTGNAVNEILSSNIALLDVNPHITINRQPTNISVASGVSTSFTIDASASDNSPLSYQWYVNCEAATNGTSNKVSACSSSSGGSTISITNESTGATVEVDFAGGLSYENFDPGVVYTLVPTGDISATVRLSGGKGGSEDRAGSPGGLGGYTKGNFTFLSGKTYKLIVGGAGFPTNPGLAENPAATASGGGNSSKTYRSTGGGAQGGGYSGIFLTSIEQSNSIIIAAGGGGATRDPASGGDAGGATGSNSGNFGVSPNRGGGGATQTSGGLPGGGGNAGSALKGGDGLASLDASGGGAGYFGGGGGGPVGGGGGGSSYVHPTLISNGEFATRSSGTFPSDFSGGGFNGRNDGRIQIIGTATGTGSANKSFANIISGANTNTLTISSSTIGLQNVYAVVSHPTAGNSPITSNTVNLSTIESRKVITFEEYNNPTGSGTANITTSNVGLVPFIYRNTSGEGTFPLLGFYAPEKDVLLEVEIRASNGLDFGSNRGGEGGVSVIRFLAERNVEFIFSPLPQVNLRGGVFLYRKSRLIAAVGSGGNAGRGSGAHGGNGGGVGVAGGNGFGRGGGVGGRLFTSGTLPPDGSFGSTPNGGTAMPCPRGNYWRNQGFQPCQDMGNVQFFLADGVLVRNSATIDRGHKAGYGTRQNAGAGIGGGGAGGQGAAGGNGGIDGGGGGGASGYFDNFVTVVSTQQGGHTGDAVISIRGL